LFLHSVIERADNVRYITVHKRHPPQAVSISKAMAIAASISVFLSRRFDNQSQIIARKRRHSFGRISKRSSNSRTNPSRQEVNVTPFCLLEGGIGKVGSGYFAWI
jgi:hypothetical protein